MALDTNLNLKWTYNNGLFRSVFTSTNGSVYTIKFEIIEKSELVQLYPNLVEIYNVHKNQAIKKLSEPEKSIIKNYFDSEECYDIMFLNGSSDNNIGLTYAGSSFSVMGSIFNECGYLLNGKSKVKDLSGNIIENPQGLINMLSFAVEEPSRISLYDKFFTPENIKQRYNFNYKFTSSFDDEGKKHWFFYR